LFISELDVNFPIIHIVVAALVCCDWWLVLYLGISPENLRKPTKIDEGYSVFQLVPCQIQVMSIAVATIAG
jgi:hypothetical protein